VYAHPDTWNGFMYVITGQQFGGIPPTIGADLQAKYAQVMALMSSWLGPLSYLAAIGLGTSAIRRPRYVLLALLAAAMTAGFAAAYSNSDLERYFLVPVFVAFTFVGLGLADIVSLGVWLAEFVASRFRPAPQPGGASVHEDWAEPQFEPEVEPSGRSGWTTVLLAAEVLVAIAVVSASLTLVVDRQHVPDATHPGGVSQADQTYRETWMRAVLASPDQGGLPANSVIVSNWFDSTTLWYGQLVEGRRADVLIVDDTMRVPAGDNLGQVWDVIDKYLGHRPVFLLRFAWNCDGMDQLSRFYTMKDFGLPNGTSIKEVTGKIGSVVCS